MPVSADCVNSRSTFGQNHTPEAVINAVHLVFGGPPDLDPASDLVANKTIQAKEFYTKDQDGFNRPWKAKNVFLNPPGKSIDSEGKQITAAQWGRKLYQHWLNGHITNAIYLCYRGGSLGSLGKEFLSDALCCMTCAGASSRAINGSGRLSFETVEITGKRTPGVLNTQSSHILLLSDDAHVKNKFKAAFDVFGVVK